MASLTSSALSVKGWAGEKSVRLLSNFLAIGVNLYSSAFRLGSPWARKLSFANWRKGAKLVGAVANRVLKESDVVKVLMGYVGWDQRVAVASTSSLIQS